MLYRGEREGCFVAVFVAACFVVGAMLGWVAHATMPRTPVPALATPAIALPLDESLSNSILARWMCEVPGKKRWFEKDDHRHKLPELGCCVVLHDEGRAVLGIGATRTEAAINAIQGWDADLNHKPAGE